MSDVKTVVEKNADLLFKNLLGNHHPEATLDSAPNRRLAGSFMPKNPEESSKNLEPTVTSSETQPIVAGFDSSADSDTGASNAQTSDRKKTSSSSGKQDKYAVAGTTLIDQKAMDQYIQARLASASAKLDKNDPHTNISWIPSFVKSLAKSRSTNDDDVDDDTSNSDSDEDSSRPESDLSAESSNAAESVDEPVLPLQPPITRAAMQFHPIFPQTMDIPAPLNQWHLYNQQKSYNAPMQGAAPPPALRCPGTDQGPDLPSIQAVKKPKRRKSSGKGKTSRKKPSKEKKEEEFERPIAPPALRELPTTAAPRTNFNQAPKNTGTCQPNYCPPCAQAPNLPPCPPTMTVPSCSQPLSACIPPASAMPAGMSQGMGGGGNGCAAAVSDPCNPCISGGYRMNNFQGGSCPELYPPQSDICRPSNGYPQQGGQQQCCPQQQQQQPMSCVELCEKSVCYCEKCENPDPNVPPQYNMQQWTCKYLRPIENGGYRNGGGQGFDGGGFQMPQGGPSGGIPSMPGCNGNSTAGAGPMGMAGPSTMGPPGSTMGPYGSTMGPQGSTMGPGGMPPGSMGPATSMGFNPMCNPGCNSSYGQQQYQQQPTGGRGCPPPGGFGSGCPPPGNPPHPPRCPVPCAPRCPPRTCYQKTFTDWGENDPRDALMSRITVYPQQQQQQQQQTQSHSRTPTPNHTPMSQLRSVAMNPHRYNGNFNPNAHHSNMVAYHPELFQVTGAISAPAAPRFDESIVPQSPRYANAIRTPQVRTNNAQAYKRPRSIYNNVKEPVANADMAEPDLLSTRASQLRYHYSQQRRTADTPRVAASKKTEIYNGDIDWKSEPKLHSSETVASKLRRQHNRNKLREINDG